MGVGVIAFFKEAPAQTDFCHDDEFGVDGNGRGLAVVGDGVGVLGLVVIGFGDVKQRLVLPVGFGILDDVVLENLNGLIVGAQVVLTFARFEKGILGQLVIGEFLGKFFKGFK